MKTTIKNIERRKYSVVSLEYYSSILKGLLQLAELFCVVKDVTVE